jgi:hypothetical protein
MTRERAGPDRQPDRDARLLAPDEKELLALTDSALQKLSAIADADYAALDLFPDFEA